MTTTNLIILILLGVSAALCILALWQDHQIEQLKGYIERLKDERQMDKR